MKRKLGSWIDSFMEYTSNGSSPPLFCKWGGISAVAGALERKVFFDTPSMGILFPNIYVIIIGPPGVGKTLITNLVGRLWNELENHHVAANSVTSASLVDELRKAIRNMIRPGAPTVQFNSLKVCANEMQVLIPMYDFDLMGKLTDIYDCLPYSESRRKEENNFKIAAPQITLLAATTPKYMNAVIPESAWDQGFLSRCFLVFSGEREVKSLFRKRSTDPKLWDNLVHDLKIISNIAGEAKIVNEAADMLDAWHLDGGPPTPDHPRIQNYNTRRTAHLIKLMTISALDRKDEPVIEVQDFERALEWLLEAEMYMSEIFKAMSSSGDGSVLDDCHYAMWKVYLKMNNTPIPKPSVYRYLQSRLPTYAVEGAIRNMENSKMIKPTTVEGSGTCYIPCPPGANKF